MPRKKKTEITVIKPNSLAEARGGMSAAFQDILDIMLSRVAKDIDEGKTPSMRYTIDAADYAEKCGLDHTKNIYRKLKIAAGIAFKTDLILTIKTEHGYAEMRIFDNIEYMEDTKQVKITCGELFSDYMLSEMERRGVKIFYQLPDTLRMDSEYSKKMYPILLENVHRDPVPFAAAGSLQGKKYKRIDKIEDFRNLIFLPESYKTSRLKEVCTLIRSEINAYTPYEVEVEYNEASIGKGRPKTTHVCWNIWPKTLKKRKNGTVENQNPEAAEENTMEQEQQNVKVQPGSDDPVTTYANIISDALEGGTLIPTDAELKILADEARRKKIDPDELQKRLQVVRMKTGVINVGAYLRTIVTTDTFVRPRRGKSVGNLINHPDNEEQLDIDEVAKLIMLNDLKKMKNHK